MNNEQNNSINMNILHKNHRNLFDLPNEILLIIIKKLNIDDVIYSLANVNERFTQLVFDPLYIQDFDITMMTMNSFYDRTFSIHEQVLSRICETILPKIHDQVKQLAIEQDSIERINFILCHLLILKKKYSINI